MSDTLRLVQTILSGEKQGMSYAQLVEELATHPDFPSDANPKRSIGQLKRSNPNEIIYIESEDRFYLPEYCTDRVSTTKQQNQVSGYWERKKVPGVYPLSDSQQKIFGGTLMGVTRDIWEFSDVDLSKIVLVDEDGSEHHLNIIKGMDIEIILGRRAKDEITGSNKVVKLVVFISLDNMPYVREEPEPCQVSIVVKNS